MVFAPFIITFREGLEAAIIIAIVIAYLSKTDKRDLNKYVWLGAGTGILASLALGIVVLLTLGSLEGVGEKLFEGTAALLATAVLTIMILWMSKSAKKVTGIIHDKIDEFVSKKFVYGISLLIFIAIFREGVETVLFLTAFYGIDFYGTLYGSLLAVIAVIVITFFLIKSTIKIPLRNFFRYTSILLIIFAAGLFGFGIHEYIEVAEEYGYNLGFLGQEAFNINPSDTGYLFHEKGVIGSVFKALVGYDGNPEWLRVIGYLAYWVIISLYLAGHLKRTSDKDRYNFEPKAQK